MRFSASLASSFSRKPVGSGIPCPGLVRPAVLVPVRRMSSGNARFQPPVARNRDRCRDFRDEGAQLVGCEPGLCCLETMVADLGLTQTSYSVGTHLTLASGSMLASGIVVWTTMPIFGSSGLDGHVDSQRTNSHPFARGSRYKAGSDPRSDSETAT